jgi:plastocyanin
VVSVRDDSYSRSSVSVKRNETVRWAWRNTSDRHSVKSGSGNPVAFASRTARGNFSFSHKFSKTGTYTIFCTVHPSFMRMKVKVTR